MKRLILILILIMTGCHNKDIYRHNPTSILKLNEDTSSFNFKIEDKFSLSMWVMPIDNNDYKSILSIKDDNNFFRLQTTLDDSGLNIEQCFDNQCEYMVAGQYFSLNYNSYNHLVLTVDECNYKLYINNDLALDKVLNNSISDFNNPIIALGNDIIYNYQHLNADSYNIELYNDILTSEDINDLYYQYYPYVLLDSITIDNIDSISNDTWLYPEIDNTYPAVWTSLNPDILTINDNRIKILKDIETDTYVDIELKVTINNKEYTKIFKVLLKAINIIDETIQYINNNINYIIDDNTNMPTNYKGVNIEYIKDKDKLNIVLSYKDIKHKYSINPIYLDKYKATLMSYQDNKDNTRYAISYDNINYKSIETIYDSTNTLDTYMFRNKTGNINIINKDINNMINIYDDKYNIISSNDLKYYNNVLKLDKSSINTAKIIYDYNSLEYVLYYSTNNGLGIYYSTSKDLINFSYPKVLSTIGYAIKYPIIDNSDGLFKLLYVDDRLYSKSLFLGYNNTLLDDEFSIIDDTYVILDNNINNMVKYHNRLIINDRDLYIDNKYVSNMELPLDLKHINCIIDITGKEINDIMDAR